MSVSATSFGKVILSGEHSAVYDQPAVAASVNLYLEATLHDEPIADKQLSDPAFVANVLDLFQNKFQVDTTNIFVTTAGNLPIGSGLGSSAAAAHAIFSALAEHFGLIVPDTEMIALVQDSERFAHGHPSGLDAVTVVKQGLIRFQRQKDEFTFEQLPAEIINKVPFVLLQSGRPVESTKEMIAIVQNQQKNLFVKKTITQMGKLTEDLIADLKKNTFIPDWIKINERFLEELGVVGEKAKQIICQIESIGGLAKVTGAGGVSLGSGILLVYHPDQEKLMAFLNQKEWIYHSVNLGQKN